MPLFLWMLLSSLLLSLTDEISFVVPGAKLYGTLVRPAGPGPAPAVLLLPGPGARSRLEERETASLPLQAALADALAAAGFASLRYDQRGQGRSISLHSHAADANAGLSHHVADAALALDYLRGQRGVAPSCLAILAHAEGTLGAASLAASAPDGLRALILLAPSMRRGHETQPPPWRHEIADLDPLSVLRQVRVPVLLLPEKADRDLPPAQVGRQVSSLLREVFTLPLLRRVCSRR